MKAVALLVAAGSGERLGADQPKAFVVLAGKPMYEWSLEALAAAGIETVIAAPAGHELPGSAPGGATRSESVRNALAAAPADAEAVLVHDAARPLVRPELFTRCLEGLARADAAIAAIPVTDTIKEAGRDRVVQRTHDRSRLWAVQTPQAFRRDALQRALHVRDEVLRLATDDAWLVERQGGRVTIVESSQENLKITTPHDLRVAELLLSDRAGSA